MCNTKVQRLYNILCDDSKSWRDMCDSASVDKSKCSSQLVCFTSTAQTELLVDHATGKAASGIVFKDENPELATNGIIANKQFPGPLITARKNDKIEVNVVNLLSDQSIAQGMSIHWHGMFQDRTASQDGDALVTQCPIAAGYSFKSVSLVLLLDMNDESGADIALMLEISLAKSAERSGITRT
ncbi:uncharacterized protein STEHIDRAFT_107395 [Stereum hirsutum FP-91666 SS1]|uniref:uncharacterized protein n=1 Tax=Stereum hirsutum (strain FP-91666) TaxID=721885 RepID=UPI000440DCD3|nr:uncharacterized protein STEHIDRAFT_107395 [Stereum hirsutum FP-91666 SS1]EIM91693.1 hypothetical protein STEHIDRAFT_107395 [Stereum hirsutum FP-91666 SS1]